VRYIPAFVGLAADHRLRFAAAKGLTQDDIDNNRITYHETVSNVISDFFTFNVSDPAGNHTANTPFQFQISPAPDTTAPVFVNDNPLVVTVGTTGTIISSLLRVDDPDNTHAQLTYTVITVPSDGTLLKNGLATSSFTQDDIDNNRITYRETATNVSSDFFIFTVSDPAGNGPPTRRSSSRSPTPRRPCLLMIIFYRLESEQQEQSHRAC